MTKFHSRPHGEPYDVPHGPLRPARRDSLLLLDARIANLSSHTVWRLLSVPASLTLGALHTVLQAAFGWTNTHLHKFELRGVTLSDLADEPLSPKRLDESDFTLGELTLRVGNEIKYEYDFGDRWDHRLTVVGVSNPPSGASGRVTPHLPRCLDALGGAIPEDSGGTSGHLRNIDILKGPNSAERRKLRSWLNECGYRAYDPDRVDVEEIQRSLDALSF